MFLKPIYHLHWNGLRNRPGDKSGYMQNVVVVIVKDALQQTEQIWRKSEGKKALDYIAEQIIFTHLRFFFILNCSLFNQSEIAPETL